MIRIPYPSRSLKVFRFPLGMFCEKKSSEKKFSKKLAFIFVSLILMDAFFEPCFHLNLYFMLQRISIRKAFYTLFFYQRVQKVFREFREDLNYLCSTLPISFFRFCIRVENFANLEKVIS
jgi:hypothetical protein